jgi:anti-sigma factor RsiW
MTRCEEFRRALGRLHDGQASPAEAEEARAHAAGCAACAADAAMLEAVAARLRERAGPIDAAPPAGLREAVVLRLKRGDAAVIELRPFLRRAAAAAAAVLLAASTAAAWQAVHRPRIEPAREAGVTRQEILAEIVRPRTGR